jgi:hypothetical protein
MFELSIAFSKSFALDLNNARACLLPETVKSVAELPLPL